MDAICFGSIIVDHRRPASDDGASEPLRIVGKAVEDPSFRAALKADPTQVVAKTLGAPLPKGMQIQVLEQSPQVTYLVLPSESGVLSDEQLDAVAGGGDEQAGCLCWEHCPDPR